jgi:hypothetical protein
VKIKKRTDCMSQRKQLLIRSLLQARVLWWLALSSRKNKFNSKLKMTMMTTMMIKMILRVKTITTPIMKRRMMMIMLFERTADQYYFTYIKDR